MTLTEDEAAFVLRQTIDQMQQDLRRRLAPYMAELSHLTARKPPAPLVLEDGQVFAYVGPTADQIAGPYRVPEWLERLASEDHILRYALTHYRERQSPATCSQNQKS